jgi:hypothetical protein
MVLAEIGVDKDNNVDIKVAVMVEVAFSLLLVLRRAGLRDKGIATILWQWRNRTPENGGREKEKDRERERERENERWDEK